MTEQHDARVADMMIRMGWNTLEYPPEPSKESQGILWLLYRGATLATRKRSVFGLALWYTRQDSCEPHATEEAKELTRAFRKYYRRCERKGLPLVPAVPLPVVVEDKPRPKIGYSLRRRGPGLMDVAHPIAANGLPDWGDRWEVFKKRGGAHYTVKHNGQIVAKFRSIVECNVFLKQSIV